MDAAVLGDRLPEVTQKPSRQPLFAVLALRESSKVLAFCERCCRSTHSLLFRGLSGGCRRVSSSLRPKPSASIARYRSRTTNQPKEEVFGTDIPRTSVGHSRGYPGPKLRSGRSKSWKNEHFGADIHEPKARTSTTPRDCQKLRSEKLWAEFSFLNRENNTIRTSWITLHHFYFSGMN